MRWLRRHLHVDVTLHKPAIRRLFTAAGMPHGRPCTIGSVCRAVRALDRDGDRLVYYWSAREACVRRLKLPAVVGFRDGDYERAAAELRNRPVVVAAMPRRQAGEGDLRDLLRAELRCGGMSEAQVNDAVAGPCAGRASTPTSCPNSSTAWACRLHLGLLEVRGGGVRHGGGRGRPGDRGQDDVGEAPFRRAWPGRAHRRGRARAAPRRRARPGRRCPQAGKG